MGAADYLTRLAALAAGTRFDSLTAGTVQAARAVTLDTLGAILAGSRVTENARLADLSPREATVLVPLVALAIFMGLASPLFTRTMEPSLDRMLREVRSHGARASAPVQSGEGRPGAQW